MNHLLEYTPGAVEACKELRKLTSVKTEWPWNRTYDTHYKNTKAIIKKNIYEVTQYSHFFKIQ